MTLLIKYSVCSFSVYATKRQTTPNIYQQDDSWTDGLYPKSQLTDALARRNMRHSVYHQIWSLNLGKVWDWEILSHLLFNLVGDVLTRMLKKASEQGLIRGLLTDFREGGVISLQYADDTILFSSVEDQHLENLKCCLVLFENLSRMRINYHKNELIPPST